MGRLNFHWVGGKNPLGRVPLGLLQRGVVERISEDIAQVYNIGITLTEHLKHELNSVLSGLTSKLTYAEPYNTVIIQYVLIY